MREPSAHSATLPRSPLSAEFVGHDLAWIMSGLMLAMFLGFLDQTIVATALSSVAREFDDWRLMSWVVSGYLVASTIATPIYGRLSDIHGRRPLLLAALGMFVAAS